MADEEKLSGKVGLDTTNFKTNVAAMNRELRVLESGFRASAASLGDWANDATGLESRIKSLNSQMDIQKQKVAATRSEYERIKQEKGENSRAAQDLEIKLNKETETLNKMENELGNTESALEEMRGSSDEAGDAVQESGEQAEEAGTKWEGFKSVVGGIGSVVKGAITVVAGLAVAVAAVGAAVGGLVFSSASAAAELVDLSAKTGISTTRLQELDFIAGQVGTDLDTITGAQARLVRSMASAQDGTGEQAKAFKSLGVSVKDANGDLRSSQDVFNETIDALGKIQNPAERDALAMQIFGKSAQELNPLIKAGADEMERLTDEAHNMGAVMDEEDVAALESFDDTLGALQDGLKGTLGTLATAFLPGFQDIFGQAGGYLQIFKDIVAGSNGDIGQIAQGVGGLIGQIVTDLAAQAPQLLQAGLGLIQSLLNAIISALPTLLPAAVQIITSLVQFIVQALPTLINAGVQILLMLVNVIVQNLPMLIDAALKAIIALATGLADALPTLIPAVVQAIITIVMTLIENIPMLIDAALQLILGLAEGLIAAIPILIPALPKIVQAIVDALIQALPMIGDAAVKLILMLVEGIVKNLPMIGKTAVQLINVLVRGILDLATKLIDVGANIVVGVWKGIQAKAGWFKSQITAFFTGMVQAAKDALGISSPSTEGMAIGDNFITSPILGAQKQLRNVERYFASAFGRMSIAAVGGMSSHIDSSVQNDQFQFFAPVIVQDTQPGGLGGMLKGKRF